LVSTAKAAALVASSAAPVKKMFIYNHGGTPRLRRKQPVIARGYPEVSNCLHEHAADNTVRKLLNLFWR
jgi:hypothetical protein